MFRGRRLVLKYLADILHAEGSYSDDALVDITLELKDISPSFSNVPYAFINTNFTLAQPQIENLLEAAGVEGSAANKVIELLLWFGFLGLQIYPDEERYAYQYQHNLQKLRSGISTFRYSIHPAFRKALGSVEG